METKFLAFLVLVVAAFGFVYFASNSDNSDFFGDYFSAKGFTGSREQAFGCRPNGIASRPASGPRPAMVMLYCAGCANSFDCCKALEGKPDYSESPSGLTTCDRNNIIGKCSSGLCTFGIVSPSPTPTPTPAGPLVTARPTLTVRTSTTPTPSATTVRVSSTPRPTVAAGTPRPSTG